MAEASQDEVRVLLLKPGDVLLVGNAGDLSVADPEVVQRFAEYLGVHVALFEGDITIGSAPVEALAVPRLPDGVPS